VFWRRVIQAGVAPAIAAVELGLDQSVGSKWFRQAGSMPPLSLEDPTGRFLSVFERERIHEGVAQGRSIRAIARELGREPSTVWRELRHNRGRGPGCRARPKPVGRPRSREFPYSPHLAQARAEERRRRPKQAKLATNPRLRVEVEARLTQRHSPQQVVARLRQDFPDDEEMRISHETIYRSLYVQGRGALRAELAAALRSGRAVRKPRARLQARGRSKIPGRVMISERPAEVADRAVPGHWEGDLIIGKDGASQIGTLVERSTRFVILLHLPGGKDAATVAEAMITQMRRLPEHLRRTLTWDQGTEMAQHARITAELGMGVYFCDPHSPWQRGSNENTNGLLRQYLPKGTDLSFYGPGMLDNIADELNNRPRQTLNWATPREALERLLSNPNETGVAPTS
jgi:IS30 family transposase